MNTNKFFLIMCAMVASGTLVGSDNTKSVVSMLENDDDFELVDDKAPVAPKTKCYNQREITAGLPGLEKAFKQAFDAVSKLDPAKVTQQHIAAKQAADAFESKGGKLSPDQQKHMAQISAAVGIHRAKQDAEEKKSS